MKANAGKNFMSATCQATQDASRIISIAGFTQNLSIALDYGIGGEYPADLRCIGLAS
jgi:hypothetical protein